MIRKTMLFLGLLVTVASVYAAIDQNTTVYAVAHAALTSDGETQHATFKGTICDDKVLNLQSTSGAVFTGVLTQITDEGVYIAFSGIKRVNVDTDAQAKELFLVWDHEYSLSFTNVQTGDELVLVMKVSQQ
jgi:hypothetical protein